MSSLRPNVLAAKQRLADGHAEFQRRHEAGCSGTELCAAIADLRDDVLLELTEAALVDLHEDGPKGLWSRIALVAHGGYGRRDVAPFSDVDLMILHAPEVAGRIAPLAERLLRDVFDVGLILGHGVRTPDDACRAACADPMVCTSLAESRLLRGSESLFHGYKDRLGRQVRRRAGRLLEGIEKDRAEERLRYGETVFLLEPNVKRSRGTLRDIQWIRWMGMVRYGVAEPSRLHELGAIHRDDLALIETSLEFLLRLRNEMHFHAGHAVDVLDRAEQLRIAELRGYMPVEGLLPVEQFMRDYFRHTDAVSHIAARFAAKAQARDRTARIATALFGHRVEDGILAGPAGIMATRRGLAELRGNLAAIVRLADLANLYDAPIAAPTWEAVRREAARLPDEPPSPEASRRFLSLLSHPARLGPLLFDLHGVGLLERFVPEFAHARGLLQFNQYHKYTVDEHCLRAVEFATEFRGDPGPVGKAYRSIAEKHILHLALLIHDLGKGRLEDHREVGLKIASDVGLRLGLPPHEIESLRFLVHKHMLMNHLAFRRDTTDEHLAVQFAVQVGSPELLQMLYVMTASDLGAVGPGVWDGWKTEVVTDLYLRTMRHLAGETPETTADEALLLGRLDRGGVSAALRYRPETGVLECQVATSESVTRGIFHKLTGALGSHGLQIRSAEIHTLPDGMVLDHFWVFDPDFAGEPPPERLAQIERALIAALKTEGGGPPTFRRVWQSSGHSAARAPGVPTRVQIDNHTSDTFTIIDVFTHDRAGLLYAITRALFDLELSVGRAKIGTYLDQVVDVFYVTDAQLRKINDEHRLEEIRQRMLDIVEGGE